MSELHKEPVEVSLEKEKCEYKRMLLMLVLYKPRPTVRHAIEQAYNSKEWDWRASDGCTAVSELYSPVGMKFPVCVMHDYYCWLASRAHTLDAACEIRAKGDELFLHGNLDFRVGRFRSYARYFGVRTYWLCIGKWQWRPPVRLDQVLL